jgi:hypothetical protein
VKRFIGRHYNGRYPWKLEYSIISSDINDDASDQRYCLIPEETCGYVPTVSFRCRLWGKSSILLSSEGEETKQGWYLLMLEVTATPTCGLGHGEVRQELRVSKVLEELLKMFASSDVYFFEELIVPMMLVIRNEPEDIFG